MYKSICELGQQTIRSVLYNWYKASITASSTFIRFLCCGLVTTLMSQREVHFGHDNRHDNRSCNKTFLVMQQSFNAYIWYWYLCKYENRCCRNTIPDSLPLVLNSGCPLSYIPINVRATQYFLNTGYRRHSFNHKL